MDKITFGRYPADRKKDGITIIKQTGDNIFTGCDGNAYERKNGNYYKIAPIVWRILQQNSGKTLLLCDKVIDLQNYGENYSDYSRSGIREWLNGEFLERAFSEREQDGIITSRVDNHSVCYEEGFYEWRSQLTGKDTFDKVFLLSVTEVFKKISSPQERTLEITDYAADFDELSGKEKRFTGYFLSKGCYPWQTRTTYLMRDLNGNTGLFLQAGIHTGMAKCTEGIRLGRKQLFGIAPAIVIDRNILGD